MNNLYKIKKIQRDLIKQRDFIKKYNLCLINVKKQIENLEYLENIEKAGK